LKPFSVYILCSQEKNYFFNVGSEALSYIYSMFTKKKLCFFNVGFETLKHIHSMFPRKKIIFSMWNLKFFHIYTSYLQEKSYVF